MVPPDPAPTVERFQVLPFVSVIAVVVNAPLVSAAANTTTRSPTAHDEPTTTV
jgi:hypothetical protein